MSNALHHTSFQSSCPFHCSPRLFRTKWNLGAFTNTCSQRGVWEGCKRLPRATVMWVGGSFLRTSWTGTWRLPTLPGMFWMSQPTPASSKHDCQGMFGKLLQEIFKYQIALGWGYANRLSLWRPAHYCSPLLSKRQPNMLTKNHNHSLVREHRISDTLSQATWPLQVWGSLFHS